MTQLKDKVVWITGASSGIGEALVYEISRKGAKVIISSRRKQELSRVKNNCQNCNLDNIQIIPLDLSQIETLADKAQQAENCFGKIDVLINCAGIGQRASVVETKVSVAKMIMEVNFWGTVALTKLVLPQMLANQSGHIVVISSLAGICSTPNRSTYAASKHALHGYFDALRAEVFQENIRVSLICPGYIKTNLTLNALNGLGEKYRKMDLNQARGISSEKCAQKIVRAIEKNQVEVYIAQKELIGIYLKRFVPSFYKLIIRKLKNI